MLDWYFGNLNTLGIVVNAVGFGLGIVAFIIWLIAKIKNEKLKKERGEKNNERISN